MIMQALIRRIEQKGMTFDQDNSQSRGQKSCLSAGSQKKGGRSPKPVQ